MGKAWNIIQTWVDAQPLDTTDAALSRALGVAQSNFDVWKNPKKLPSHEALGAISELTGRPYRDVLEAFLDDIGYSDPPSQERMAARKGKSTGRAKRKAQDDAETGSQEDPNADPSGA